MKRAAFIVNFHSGMKKSKSDIQKYLEIFSHYDYDVVFFETKYSNHAEDIVRDLEEDIDLVVSVGGDGTFHEVVSGNFKRSKQLLLSHIPYGTTNDVGTMFAMDKNIEKNLASILSPTTSEIRKVDICTINDQPFVYVAGVGRFMNIPYETPRKMKKRLGHLAYLIEGIHDFFHNKTHLYDITYEVDGQQYQGLYSFVLISNANRIAGINNFYKDVRLDDGMFEILLCNLTTKKDIVKSLFGLKIADIRNISGFYFYKTNDLKLTFHERLKKPWCLDGEECFMQTHTYTVRMKSSMNMLLPKKMSKELFCSE